MLPKECWRKPIRQYMEFWVREWTCICYGCIQSNYSDIYRILNSAVLQWFRFTWMLTFWLLSVKTPWAQFRNQFVKLNIFIFSLPFSSARFCWEIQAPTVPIDNASRLPGAPETSGRLRWEAWPFLGTCWRLTLQVRLCTNHLYIFCICYSTQCRYRYIAFIKHSLANYTYRYLLKQSYWMIQ